MVRPAYSAGRCRLLAARLKGARALCRRHGWLALLAVAAHWQRSSRLACTVRRCRSLAEFKSSRVPCRCRGWLTMLVPRYRFGWLSRRAAAFACCAARKCMLALLPLGLAACLQRSSSICSSRRARNCYRCSWLTPPIDAAYLQRGSRCSCSWCLLCVVQLTGACVPSAGGDS